MNFSFEFSFDVCQHYGPGTVLMSSYNELFSSKCLGSYIDLGPSIPQKLQGLVQETTSSSPERYDDLCSGHRNKSRR